MKGKLMGVCVSIVLCMVLLFSSYAVAGANGEEVITEQEVLSDDVISEEGFSDFDGVEVLQNGYGIMYAYISSHTESLSISSTGTATAQSALTGYPGTTTKVVINMCLQQLNGGTWTTLSGGSWSETFISYKGSMKKTKAVTKGYSYRVKAAYEAYNGTKKETATFYSATVKY